MAPCKQKRVHNAEDVVFQESQQLEMTCPGTELRTPASCRSMWSDFTNAVRDWPAPTAEAIARGEGWVSAKRGRGLSPEHRIEQRRGGKDLDVGEHDTLNLNLSPETHTATEMPQGRGRDAPSKNSSATNNFGGKGSGRGTARARRPPAVQPRFHSPVSCTLRLIMSSCACEAALILEQRAKRRG